MPVKKSSVCVCYDGSGCGRCCGQRPNGICLDLQWGRLPRHVLLGTPISVCGLQPAAKVGIWLEVAQTAGRPKFCRKGSGRAALFMQRTVHPQALVRMWATSNAPRLLVDGYTLQVGSQKGRVCGRSGICALRRGRCGCGTVCDRDHTCFRWGCGCGCACVHITQRCRLHRVSTAAQRCENRRHGIRAQGARRLHAPTCLLGPRLCTCMPSTHWHVQERVCGCLVLQGACVCVFPLSCVCVCVHICVRRT